jgi:hypothetical protein
MVNYEEELNEIKSTVINLMAIIIDLQNTNMKYERAFEVIGDRLDALESDAEPGYDEIPADLIEEIKIKFEGERDRMKAKSS